MAYYAIDEHAVLRNCSIHLAFLVLNKYAYEILLGDFNGVALPVTDSYANSCFNHSLYLIHSLFCYLLKLIIDVLF